MAGYAKNSPGPHLPASLLAQAVGGTELRPKEAQVVKLLAMGYTQPEIAKKLFKSTETIKSQSKMARARLGAKTNAQAVAIAISLDMI